MWNKFVIDDFSLDMWEISMERQIDINSNIYNGRISPSLSPVKIFQFIFR